jgi:metal-sulfur cluster biosynthetic enzyme
MLERDAGQAVEPDELDQRHDLRLRRPQRHLAALRPHAAREHHEVEHQRRVGPGELGQVDDDVARGLDRPDERPAPPRLRRKVLVSAAAERSPVFDVLDDGGETNERCRFGASEINGLSPSSKRNFIERVVVPPATPEMPGVGRLHWAAMPTLEEVNEALSNVIDPELGLDFVELGLVYDVQIDGSTVDITFTLTTPACPIGPQVSEQMIEFVGDLPDVEQVNPRMVFSPPWSPDRMSEDAKFALGF